MNFSLDGLKLNAYLNGLRFDELPNNVKVRFFKLYAPYCKYYKCY